MRRLLYISMTLIALAIAACSTDECYDNRNALPLADLYASGSGKTVAIDSVSMWGVGVPRDSMLLDTARNVQQFYFPFRIDDSSSDFVIRYDALLRLMPKAPNDTIRFSYKPVPVFESAACGVYYRFDDVKISHTSFLIDSVICPQGFIDNSQAANLKVYFRQ